jgi:hypothetical protein
MQAHCLKPESPMAGEDTSLEEELVELQASLYMQDFFVKPRARGVHYLLLSQMKKIRLRMDSNKQYRRPHLHIDYGRQHRTATYAIDTGERLAGELDRKYDGRVANWIENYRVTLLRSWNRLQTGQNADELELHGAE